MCKLIKRDSRRLMMMMMMMMMDFDDVFLSFVSLIYLLSKAKSRSIETIKRFESVELIKQTNGNN